MVQKGCGTVLMKRYRLWEVLRNVPDITSLDTTILPFIHILQFLLSDTLSIYLLTFITFHYLHYFFVRLLCPVPMLIILYVVHLKGLGYMRAFPYERILRDTRIMMIFEVNILSYSNCVLSDTKLKCICRLVLKKACKMVL